MSFICLIVNRELRGFKLPSNEDYVSVLYFSDVIQFKEFYREILNNRTALTA